MENLIERILVLYRPRSLEPELLRKELPLVFGRGEEETLDERATILRALQQCGGNKTEVSKLLKMPRRTLYYKLKRYGISETEYGS